MVINSHCVFCAISLSFVKNLISMYMTISKGNEKSTPDMTYRSQAFVVAPEIGAGFLAV